MTTSIDERFLADKSAVCSWSHWRFLRMAAQYLLDQRAGWSAALVP
jgi:hypothetical protein